jgi:hypothetical protein
MIMGILNFSCKFPKCFQAQCDLAAVATCLRLVKITGMPRTFVVLSHTHVLSAKLE